jgi:hypothetical protein
MRSSGKENPDAKWTARRESKTYLSVVRYDANVSLTRKKILWAKKFDGNGNQVPDDERDTPKKCNFTLGFCMLNFSIAGCPKFLRWKSLHDWSVRRPCIVMLSCEGAWFRPCIPCWLSGRQLSAYQAIISQPDRIRYFTMYKEQLIIVFQLLASRCYQLRVDDLLSIAIGLIAMLCMVKRLSFMETGLRGLNVTKYVES